MKMYAILLAMSTAVAGGLLSGCMVRGATYVAGPRPYYRREAVIVAPAPVLVAPVPAPVVVPPPPPVVVVHRAPPATVIVDPIPAPPGVGFVWIPGFYEARGDDWVWVRGHYDRPPRPGAVWVAPRQERYGDGYRFERGHWR